MFAFPDEPTSLKLRVMENSAHGMNGTAWYSCLVQERKPLLGVFLLEDLLKKRDQQVAVTHPLCICGKACICRQILAADQMAKHCVEMVITASNDHVSVACGKLSSVNPSLVILFPKAVTANGVEKRLCSISQLSVGFITTRVVASASLAEEYSSIE